MIIRPIARNTTAPAYTCAPENPYCLSTQRESTNNASSPATTTTTTNPTHLLTHRNLVGVLIIAALLALGLILWLCFGRWSKPIRHFLRGESRQDENKNTVRFGIGAGPASINGATASSKQQSAALGSQANANAATDSDDAEKAGIVDSSSSSQSSLDNKGRETTKAKLEPAPPAKVR